MQDNNRHDNTVSPPRVYAEEKFSVWASKIIALPQSVRIMISFILLAFVGALDKGTGTEISFSVFYLLPAAFAGGFVSRRAGWLMAFASAAVWGFLDVTTGQGYSNAWIPYWNSGVRLGFFLIVNELIDMLQKAHAHTRKLSRTDTLTGLANARVFQEHTSRVIAQSRRDGQPFTITYIDLDRFKQVNDEFGHSEGDRLLQRIASLIGNGVRTTDFVARLGGDEFAILMPGTGMEQAQGALKRIAASITDHVEGHWKVGATFGVVTFREPPDDVDTAIRQADDLMYRGKAEGRGCILQATWPESRATRV